ncbi:MAG: hypothetical protein DMD35_04025 [Gemmatimonadetes bacterium]|nr:MAG: hypothetical protein DMD35_04025 [Gemmatimonadota bacterium]
MSESSSASLPRVEWWTRPRVVLPLVAALVVFVALITPQANGGRTGDQRLSTHLSGAMGAKLLYATADRLGWHVAQRDSQPMPSGATGTTIHAVLAPPIEITPAEAHGYLDAVRGGDALLLVLDERNALADSLGVRHAGGGQLAPAAPDTAGCPSGRSLIPPLWPDGRVHLWSIRWTRRAPADRTRLVSVRPDLGTAAASEAAVGFALGRGRVAIVSDPDLLRNDVIRRCDWGADVRVVRVLEWLRDGGPTPRTRLVFDEYHQGYGPRASMIRTTRRFLIDHPVGRTILQIVLAALVLLLAAAPRALPPADLLRVERRDPLEQIDALAHAYEQVRATRTLAARLLRGVRSRVERGWSAARARPDDAFLADAEHQVPSLAADVALVRRALAETLPERSLPELGAAFQRIEHSLATSTHA